MPARPLRLCAGDPLCDQLTTGGPCPDHQPDRGTTTERGYGWSWQKTQAKVIAEEPTCRVCGEPSVDVDHIDGDVTNPARSNLQGVCRLHHNRKTARQPRRY